MLVRLNFLVFCLVDVMYACIPTQQVDDSTTTTAVPTTTQTTTTTTADPGPAYPCTGCPKIYDANCVGFQSITEPWCAPQSEVGNVYLLGVIQGWGDANTCSTAFACPLGTTSEYVLFGFTLPGPPWVVAWCQQDGANAGKWYYGIPPLALPIQLASLTCRGAYIGK